VESGLQGQDLGPERFELNVAMLGKMKYGLVLPMVVGPQLLMANTKSGDKFWIGQANKVLFGY